MMANSEQSPRQFLLEWNRGGIKSLKLKDDVFDTEYITPGETLGEILVGLRVGGEEWRSATTFSSGDIRTVEENGRGSRTFVYSGDAQLLHGLRGLGLVERFSLEEGRLIWGLAFHNETDETVEIGDIGLPLPFNKQFVRDNLANYTQVVARHSFISGHGSFLFWQRPNGVGPYLVMTPLPGTKLEYYEEIDTHPSTTSVPYRVYIHSALSGGKESRGTWRQPHTGVPLSPQGTEGDRVDYGFCLQWADDYEGVRDALYREGLFDVHVVPGMTVPNDLSAIFSMRTKHNDYEISAEFPDKTSIELVDEPQVDTRSYLVRFTRLGENLLTVKYGDSSYMNLEFFVTEPLETLIKKRTSFLVDRQQHRGTGRWYEGLFSVWDMREAVLRGPENTGGFDGWYGYTLTCDDTALPKAPFIAAKNVHFPEQGEIEAVEYYIEKFVWGGLQRTDEEEPYPYFIYGVPNWYENRHSEHGFGTRGEGQEHFWRSYDYPHMIMLYFHMYQIAKLYPGSTSYLDSTGYLERAFGTAEAHFRLAGLDDLPHGAQGYWAYRLGLYNEVLIVDLIEALEEEGWQERADWLRGEWEKKVKFFVYDDPYPFDSEYPFDTTAFETSHAVAKYGLTRTVEPDSRLWYDKYKDAWYEHSEVSRADFEEFMEKQIQANIALRGWVEPSYTLLGGDNRGGDSSRYGLSYMSQLGGWVIVDYALYFAEDPFPYLRLGYASILSSWCLMNTGTAESNYGYWYPGKENDGASGWAITPEKYSGMWIRQDNGRGSWPYDGEIELGYGAALRTATTIVADDPIFGWFAYGGRLEMYDGRLDILPQDGLRQRVHVVARDSRLHLLLDRDGFAGGHPVSLQFANSDIDGGSSDVTRIRFRLENRSRDKHHTTLRVRGLRQGSYVVRIDGESTLFLEAAEKEWSKIVLGVVSLDVASVEIEAD
uniref:Uncharacterized protein n=1 Tax=uncultured marine bacterium 1n22 TaxID=662659 RepID=D2DIQ4_9BACT|nr:conserved hypothetical protein [uncultured marine bacterium 1n22]